MNADCSIVLEIDSHSASLAAVEGFDDDWIADLAGCRYGAVFAHNADGPGNREATVAQKVARQFLVGRNLRRDKAVGGDIGSPDALLEFPVSELHQRKPPACSA